jgi:hypothetical protein
MFKIPIGFFPHINNSVTLCQSNASQLKFYLRHIIDCVSVVYFINSTNLIIISYKAVT